MKRALALLLLYAPLPLAAEPPAAKSAPTIPQPVLLDWGGQFRLNSPPTNVSNAGLKQAAEEEDARKRRKEPTAAPTGTTVPLGPEDPARTRYSSRGPTSNEATLNAPLASTGPVSLGASYGKYRAVPNIPTREVSADDMRVTLGIPF